MIGVFHPLLVHLPIGILLLGALFAILGRRPAYHGLLLALPLILLLGALSAWASCLTGWLLAGSGDYDEGSLAPHRYWGLVTAVLATLILLLKKYQQQWPLWLMLSIALIVTGHLGGTLTHGEGFLWTADSSQHSQNKTQAYAGPIEDARVYADLIQPIISEKCVSCHGEKKKKGGLRLDTPEWIRKGGKHGGVLSGGYAEDNKLFQRLLLPEDNDEHMPPKGKPQLTAVELALIRAWINQGAAFEGRVRDMANAGAFVAASTTKNTLSVSAIPTAPVAEADTQLIRNLQREGIVVLPVFAGSPYLSVSFQGLPTAGDSLVSRLEPLAPQIVWLKLSGTQISDAAISHIARLTALRRLWLDHTSVSNIAPLGQLQQLQYLNLVATAAGKNSRCLADFPALRQVFLYNSQIDPQVYSYLQKQNPGLEIDMGGYQVPTWQGDTTIMVRK